MRLHTPLHGNRADYDPLIALVGDARFVLLGESSQGTNEFYNARAEITQRLITEKGFNAVAVEADWPDAYRINRYVQGIDEEDVHFQLSGVQFFFNCGGLGLESLRR